MSDSHIFRKRWGQNFLIDENILKKISLSVDPQIDNNIIEIGPGDGALTQILLPQVNDMLSIEIDPLLVKSLNNKESLKKDLTN